LKADREQLRVVADLLFFTGERGGTETYAREILRRLPEALPTAEFVGIANRIGAERIREFFPGHVEIIPTVGGDRITWAAGEILEINRRARRLRADIIWCPSNFGPLRPSAGISRVTTTHDVTYGLTGRGIIPRLTSSLVAGTARTSTEIITGSGAAAATIVDRLEIAPDLITVIPHGTSDPRPAPDPWEEVAALGIDPGRRVVLSTGNRLPHKNFEGLLRAMQALPSPRPLLVLPGSHGEDPLVPVVGELDLSDDVVLPGWVTTAQLESLFAIASLYVCPSITEGFGLPVLDAMRRGCVVLANDVPVLREVGGDAALYADVRSASGFAGAMQEALSADQSERRAAGIRRSEAFTWERSTQRTAEVLVRAANSRMPS
jgi:glycosyltransferase involved in cell wall biosynthesis